MVPSERNNISPLAALIIAIAIIVGMAWSLSKVGELMLTFATK